MGWRTHTYIGKDGTVHTWPESDADHQTEGPPCWCRPHLIEHESGVVQVIHRDELDRLVVDPPEETEQ